MITREPRERAEQIKTYAASVLAADLIELRRIYGGLFSAVAPHRWDRSTERWGRGWTLRETVAHLLSAALLYDQAIDAALAGVPLMIPGVARREDLGAWNKREIATHSRLPIEEICATFLETLRASAHRAARLTASELAATVYLPLYGSTLTVAELLGGSLAHAGLVHAAQVAAGAGTAPLWVHYDPALLRRQITRLFAIAGHSYWPERGGDLRAAVLFEVDGPGGGFWHVTMAPDGGRGGAGSVEQAAVRLWFADIDLFCRGLTLRANPILPLLTRRVRISGNLVLLARFPYLFMPT